MFLAAKNRCCDTCNIRIAFTERFNNDFILDQILIGQLLLKRPNGFARSTSIHRKQIARLYPIQSGVFGIHAKQA